MSKVTLTYKTDPSAGDIPAEVHFNDDKSSTPKPIVLIFHAGGFAGGATAMVSPAEIRALVALGFVVANVAYRLVPQVTLLEGPLADARDALAWAQTQLPALLAERAGLAADGARVAAMGHSAGGGMALWLGALPQPPKAILDFYGVQYLRDPAWHRPAGAPFAHMPAPDPAVADRVVEGPVPVAGVPMLLDGGRPNLEAPRAAWLIRGLQSGSWCADVVRGPREAVPEEEWVEVEPTRGFGAGFPPTCFVHGDADTTAPVALARRAHDELVGHGVASELVVVEGAPHLFDAALKEDDAVFQQVFKGLQFLRDHV